MEIAAIFTCYNRKQKTISCLQSLFDASDLYNADKDDNDKVSISVYMTDDACTDGTADAVREKFAERPITIVLGNGSCYWAGGMRLAWRDAINSGNRYAFYLLLNDDTELMDNVFSELFFCHQYALQHYGKPGIYSGIVCQPGHPEIVTYSGDVFTSNSKSKFRRLGPSDNPQMVDQTNANILMVSAGFPALITRSVCGACEYDHLSQKHVLEKLMNMTLAERKQYVYAPTHSDKDYLLFVRRNIPQKYMVSWCLRKLRLYCPGVYYRICKYRGLEEYQ